jgi:signal peptidase II
VEQTPMIKTLKFKWMASMTAIWLIVDQVTKIWVVNNIAYRTEEIKVIDGFFSLVHAQNKGAAGGMLSSFEYRMPFFAVVTVIALVVLWQMYREIPDDDKFQAAALGLIFSGALGNAIDRIDKQSVTDFLRVYTEHETLKPWLLETFGTYEWPSFNVADAAICVGLGMFLLHFAFLQEEDDELEPEPPENPVQL